MVVEPGVRPTIQYCLGTHNLDDFRVLDHYLRNDDWSSIAVWKRSGRCVEINEKTSVDVIRSNLEPNAVLVRSLRPPSNIGSGLRGRNCYGGYRKNVKLFH